MYQKFHVKVLDDLVKVVLVQPPVVYRDLVAAILKREDEVRPLVTLMDPGSWGQVLDVASGAYLHSLFVNEPALSNLLCRCALALLRLREVED